MGDLASGTSSRSTKLIHGGLRYLEQYDFRLVREALTEREVLWQIAPAHRAPAALRAAATGRACGPHGCCAPASSSTTTWAAASGCPARACSTLRRDAAGAPLEARRIHDRLRVLGLLGRRRAPRRPQRARCRRPRRRDPHAHARARGRARGGAVAPDGGGRPHRRAGHRDRTHARQCRRTLGRARGGREPPRQDARPRAPGAGLPHRGPQAVRARSRLHLPEPGRPRRVRHPLRGRLHADRHHRPRLSRRPCGGDCNHRGGRLSVRGSQRLVRGAGAPERRAVDLLGRAAPL